VGTKDLRSIFWDYDIPYSSEELYHFLVGHTNLKDLNRNQVLAKMLTSMRWYDLVDIFGINQLYQFLDDDVLKYIWKKSLKTRYTNVRETLETIL
jgi:hypothetical protein